MSRIRAIPRKDRPGTYQLIGTIPGFKGIRKTAKAHTQKLADQEAALLEAELLHEAIHGKPKGRADRYFAEIAEAYLIHEPRRRQTENRVKAVVRALGNVMASEVNQDAINRIRQTLIKKPNPAPWTVRGVVITPVRAVLNFGAKVGWCDRPNFLVPKVQKARGVDTKFFYPDQAQLIIENAIAHAQPVFVTLFGIGSRITETLTMDWEFVDLPGATARLIQKGGRERVVDLPPAVVAALADIPYPHEGRVFKWQDGMGRWHDYSLNEGVTKSLRRAWVGALRRAGLPYRSIHTTRHTYATWHYALHRDPYLLMRDGGWESLPMVQRYTKLIPRGHEDAINQFWGYTKSAPEPDVRQKYIA